MSMDMTSEILVPVHVVLAAFLMVAGMAFLAGWLHGRLTAWGPFSGLAWCLLSLVAGFLFWHALATLVTS
jgi:hypothetical protein